MWVTETNYLGEARALEKCSDVRLWPSKCWHRVPAEARYLEIGSGRGYLVTSGSSTTPGTTYLTPFMAPPGARIEHAHQTSQMTFPDLLMQTEMSGVGKKGERRG